MFNLIQSPPIQAIVEKMHSCLYSGQLLLSCGKRIPLLCSTCIQPSSSARSQTLAAKVRVGTKYVDVLKYTICRFIENQYALLLTTNAVSKVVDTAYLS